MTEEHLQFTVRDRKVSGLRIQPENQASACTLVYAPGAGSNLQDPFGNYLAEHLCRAGITTIRFQFPDDTACNSECLLVHPVTGQIFIITKSVKKGEVTQAINRVWSLPAVTDYDTIHTAKLELTAIPAITKDKVTLE